ARRNPGGAAGLGEEHQRQQPRDLTVVRHEGTDQASEPDRLGGQIVTYGIGVGAGRQVALVEDEEKDGEYTGDPGREILRGRHPIRDASRLDLGLRAGDPLPHGGLLHQEGTRDLGHGQTGDHAQRQRRAGLHRKRRVTAGEDQPEPLVVDGAGRPGRVVVVQQLSLLLFVVALVLAPDPVDGLAVGGGGEPGAGAGGHAVGRPPLDGGRERLGRRLFGDVEITEAPGQGGDHPGPLLAVRLGDRLTDVGHAHRHGRTSIFRLQAFDPSAASLSATSRSAASMIQKPTRYSFDSTKGPSLNIASSPRLSKAVAERGAPRPPAKTQCPAAMSRSLNTSMAACSSGVPELVLSLITETRYCISDHLLWFGAPLLGSLSPLLRTPLPRSDTASRISFEDSGTPVVNDPARRSHRWTPAPPRRIKSPAWVGTSLAY